MIAKIKKFIQKVKCSIPFNLTYFGHKRLIVVKQLSRNTQLVKCLDCGRLFGVNHDVRIVLPWEDVKNIYLDFGDIFEEHSSMPFSDVK